MIRKSTAASRAYWRRVTTQASRFAPEVRQALRLAYERLLESIPEAQLADWIAKGGVERVMVEAMSDPALNDAFKPIRATINRGLNQSTTYSAKHLPTEAARLAAVNFNVLEPQVLEALSKLDTRVLQTLKKQVRETTRQVVENGLREGAAPREIARALRSVIPLAPNQAEAVRNFQRALQQRPGASSPLDYALRDHRFDSMIERARRGEITLSASQINNMTESYRRRYVSFNAETNARTTALDTYKAGNRLAWDNAIENGVVEGDDLLKTWRGTLDDKERPEHLAMEGETVPADEPYSNGQMEPGDDEFNCRCISQYSLKKASS